MYKNRLTTADDKMRSEADQFVTEPEKARLTAGHARRSRSKKKQAGLIQSHGRNTGKNRSSSHEQRLSSGSRGASKKLNKQQMLDESKGAILKKALNSQKEIRESKKKRRVKKSPSPTPMHASAKRLQHH